MGHAPDGTAPRLHRDIDLVRFQDAPPRSDKVVNRSLSVVDNRRDPNWSADDRTAYSGINQPLWPPNNRQLLIGVWLSLVEQRVWGAKVVGSNPTTPTNMKGIVMEYAIQPGDTLSSIALAHLGSALRWPEIWGINQTTIRATHTAWISAHGKLPAGMTSGPDLIFPGTIIKIPT